MPRKVESSVESLLRYQSVDSFHTYVSSKEEMEENDERKPLLTADKRKSEPVNDRFFTVMFSSQLVVVALLVTSIVVLWIILQTSTKASLPNPKHLQNSELSPTMQPHTATLNVMEELMKTLYHPSIYSVNIPEPCCNVQTANDLLNLFVRFSTGTYSNQQQILKERLNEKIKSEHNRRGDVIDSALHDVPKSLLDRNGTFILVRMETLAEKSFQSSQYVIHCVPVDATTVEVTRYDIQGDRTVINNPVDQLNLSFTKNLERSSAYGATNYTFDPSTEFFKTAYTERLSTDITFASVEKISFNHICSDAKFYVNGNMDQKSHSHVEFEKVLDSFSVVLDTLLNGYDVDIVVNTSSCNLTGANQLRFKDKPTMGMMYNSYAVFQSDSYGPLLFLGSQSFTGILRPGDKRLFLTSGKPLGLTSCLFHKSATEIHQKSDQLKSFKVDYGQLVSALKISNVKKILVDLRNCSTNKRAWPFGLSLKSVGFEPSGFQLESSKISLTGLPTSNFRLDLQVFSNNTFIMAFASNDALVHYRCASLSHLSLSGYFR